MSFFWITSYVINPLAFFHLFPLTIALLIATPRTGHTQVLEQDSLALVAFYNSTGGPGWTNNTGWLIGPVSTWYGVTVEGDRVVKLTLYYSNNLSGTIPEEIGDLSELKTLVIGYNLGITGSIPNSIGQLYQLQSLGIGNCSLTGLIPTSIGNLTKLDYLDFTTNSLSGPIPLEIGNIDSLFYLELANNQLTGPIPPELGNCSKLYELRLSNNQLSGEIPAELAQCTELNYLDLSYNQLEGEVPSGLSAVTLEDLFLNDNRLTGLPPWNPNWLLNALCIENNRMTYEDIEPHFVGYIWFIYCPQDSMAQRIDTVVPQGSSFSIYSGTLGEFTTYYWTHNGEQIPDTENADTLHLTNLTPADAGDYMCWANNSKCFWPNGGMPMVLLRRPVHLDVSVGVEEANGIAAFRVFPNPATQHVTVEVAPQPRPVEVILTDVQGRRVAQQVLPAGETRLRLPVAGLERGVYCVIANDGNAHWNQLIVVGK